MTRIRSTCTHLTSIALIAALPGAANAQEEAERVAWPTPTLQVQTWFTAYDQDEDPQADPGGYGDPEHDVGFSIPRARLGLNGQWRWVHYSVRIGTSRPYDAVSEDPAVIDLVDGWFSTRFKTKGGLTSLTVGQHQVPFSREMTMSSGELVFQERAVSTNWLAPNRDLGFTASHEWTFLKVSAGVYNGGGDRFGDVDPGVQVATRLDLSFGGDGLVTNQVDNTIAFGAAYIYNPTPATTTQRVNVDLLARFQGLTLQLEGGMNWIAPDAATTFRPPDVEEQTRRIGGMAQLTYFRPLAIGAIEPAIRFSYFDDAIHLKDNGDVGILHAGLTWREPVPFVDIGAGYIHRVEFQGRSLANDSVRVWLGFRYPGPGHKPHKLNELFKKKSRSDGNPA